MTYAWHDLGDGRKVYRREPEPIGARSHLPTPYVVSDTMPPTEHLDGRFYESKSTYRAVTKAHGCIEIGNDPARLRPKQKTKPDDKAIKDAVQKASAMVKAGYRPS